MNKNEKLMLYGLMTITGVVAIILIYKKLNPSTDIASNDTTDDAEKTPMSSKPIEPPQVYGLTPLQAKQEKLQSLLGFSAKEIDHIIGSKTISAYNKLNLGLNINLSKNTSIEDLQKIIDAIVQKNNKQKSSALTNTSDTRAKNMIIAWNKNPTSLLVPNKTTKLYVVNLDRTTNTYFNTGNAYTYNPKSKFTREQLNIVEQTDDFVAPYRIIFKNNAGQLLLANPNDWIIK